MNHRFALQDCPVYLQNCNTPPSTVSLAQTFIMPLTRMSSILPVADNYPQAYPFPAPVLPAQTSSLTDVLRFSQAGKAPPKSTFTLY